jgi:zinc/manganese transport system permease protein
MLLFQYPFMLSALALCLVLAGILGAFGHHVVRRGVIFADLALAQSAALGASAAHLLGYGEGHPAAAFAFSLGAACLAALLFAWFGSRRRIPIEALIGLTYAGALASTLILLERAATGTEELMEMLAGSILTVSPRQLAATAAVSGAAALLLWAARRPLFQITEDADAARAAGRRVALWDVAFYSLFGLVVSVAVKAAGVLLVFAFLVAPSLASLLAARTARKRIAFGWAFGAAGCLLGLEASLRFDWSAGPTVVATLIALLGLTGALSAVRGSRPP